MKTNFNAILISFNLASSLIIADTFVSVAEDDGSGVEGTLSWAINQVNSLSSTSPIVIQAGINPSLLADMPDMNTDVTIQPVSGSNTIDAKGHKVISAKSGKFVIVEKGIILKDTAVSVGNHDLSLIFRGAQSSPVSLDVKDEARLKFELDPPESFTGFFTEGSSVGILDIPYGGMVNLSGNLKIKELTFNTQEYTSPDGLGATLNFTGDIMDFDYIYPGLNSQFCFTGNLSSPNGTIQTSPNFMSGKLSGDVILHHLDSCSGTILLSGKNTISRVLSCQDSTIKVSSIENLFSSTDQSGIFVLSGGGALHVAGNLSFRLNDSVYFSTGSYTDDSVPRTFILNVDEMKTLNIPKALFSANYPNEVKGKYPAYQQNSESSSNDPIFDLILDGFGESVIPVFDFSYSDTAPVVINVKGPLYGKSGLTMTGSYGTLVLESCNKFTGQTSVGSYLTLKVAPEASMGTTSDKIVIEPNATLIVDGSLYASEIENYGTLSGSGTINGAPVTGNGINNMSTDSK
jgi:hypothetical protein